MKKSKARLILQSIVVGLITMGATLVAIALLLSNPVLFLGILGCSIIFGLSFLGYHAINGEEG